jgi:SAM-dependent methyltransferase
MPMLDQQFWDDLYLRGETRWDLGEASPPLRAYIDQLEDKHASVLIPGAGNAHEALYLNEKGFTGVTVVDISAVATANLRRRAAGPAGLKVITSDFFGHTGKYDLILEQTFFCALEPQLRERYARHARELLAPGGKLAGVLFNRTFEAGHPPYGGDAGAYRKLFEPYFTFNRWAPCLNSAPERAGSEWFMELQRR